MAPGSADEKLTAATCADCGCQLTLTEFRESRGSAHRCASCRIKGGHPAARRSKPKPASQSRKGYWTGQEKLTICSVCDEGIRLRERHDGEWVAYEDGEDRRHRHRG